MYGYLEICYVLGSMSMYEIFQNCQCLNIHAISCELKSVRLSS